MKPKLSFNRVTLKNGLRLLTAPNPEAKSVGVSLFVTVGSRHERGEINGISHFLEHLVFKGTRRFPNSRAIADEIEGLGGLLNGYTNSALTCFWAKVLPEQLPAAFAVLTDLVLSPRLKEKDVETEKGVIVEEIRRRDDDPLDEVLELSQRSLWEDSPLGFSTLGSEATVRNLQRSDLVGYWEEFYRPENFVICLAGDFEVRQATEMVARRFSDLAKGRAKNPSGAVARGGKVLAKVKKTAQAHLVFAFPAFPYSAAKRYALDVTASLLGTGLGSRLFQNVRDKGLAYAIHCLTDFYDDTGAFLTYAGVEKERLAEAVTTILTEFSKMRQQTVLEPELQKAKEKIKGPFLFHLEDPQKMAEYLGYQEAAYGSIEDFPDYLRRIDAVTATEVRSLSREIFAAGNLSLISLSPFNRTKFEPFLDSQK